MATPEFQIQSTTVQMNRGGAGSIKFLTKNSAGAPVDVSSGYTVKNFYWHTNSANYNPNMAPTDLKANMSFAFDATGVTVSWTGAQASTIAPLLTMLVAQYGLMISDDANATSSILATGQFVMNYNYGATS